MQLFSNGDLVSSGRLAVQGEAEFTGLTLVGTSVSSTSAQNSGAPSIDDESTNLRHTVLSIRANGGA